LVYLHCQLQVCTKWALKGRKPVETMNQVSPFHNEPDGATLREFEEFYRRHFAALSRFVTRRLPAISHDEVLAAAFVVAWKKFETVERPSLPWLYRIAALEVANERRRLGRKPEVVELSDVHLIDKYALEDVMDISSAFSKLNDGDQEILRLLFWEDLSRPEIAVVLNCSVNTLNARIQRALERLRGALSREELITKNRQHPAPSKEDT
jgi:RNA polymerase sigma-70 factor, ECF subfamily